MEPEEKPLLRNGSANTPVARQWLISCHVRAATGRYAIIEQLLESMFSVQSGPRLYNDDQLVFM
jgi:hypothetical protein